MHQQHAVITQQSIELVSERTERSGLDLDQLLGRHVLVTDDVDHEPLSRNLERITGSCVVPLERCMQRALVERADAWLHENIDGRGLVVCDTRS